MHYNLVKKASRAYLEEMANRADEMPEVYQCVNVLQQTPFKINKSVLQVVKTIIGKGLTVGQLPSTEKIQIPVKPFDIGTNEEAKQKYKIKARKAYDEEAIRVSKCFALTSLINLAETYEDFDEFYYPLQYDFRGRIYPVPSGLTYQDSDLAKSLLLFSDGKPLGSQEAVDRLAIHGANVFGEVDKKDFATRIKWVLDNEKYIIECAKDPHNHYDFWGIASEPYQFLAFCFEWNDFVNSKKSLSFVTNLICFSDCSNSGLQIFSGMLKDKAGGKATNVISNAEPQDVYKEVAEKTIELLEDMPESIEKKMWLEYGINRKTTKKVTMCIVYGLTKYSCRDYIEEHLKDMQEEEGKKNPFASSANPQGIPTTFQATNYLAKIVWKALDEVIVSAKKVMSWLQDTAKLVAENGLPVTWRTPTGFIVQMITPEFQTKRISTNMGEKIYRPKSGKFTYDIRKTVIKIATDKINKRKLVQSIAPSFVHALDGAILQRAVCKAYNDYGIRNFACVHDSYGVLAPDVVNINKSVRYAFHNIFSEGYILENFLNEITLQVAKDKQSEIKKLPTQGELNIDEVLNSDYFCS